MIKKQHWTALSLAGLGCLGACQAGGSTPVPPGTAEQRVDWQVLHADAYCGSVQAAVTRIADAQALAAATRGGDLQIPADPPSSPPPAPALAIDFQRTLVLKLSMGQRPNAGWQFQVQSMARPATPTGPLTIHTLWKSPEPGTLQAQVMTQPCVIVAVPRGGERSVQMVDQTGQAKAVLKLDAGASSQ